MRRLGRICPVLLLLATLVAMSTPAHAAGCPAGTAPSANDGLICIPVQDPGTTGDDNNSGGSGTNSPVTCSFQGETIPCEWSGGRWSNSNGCYLIPTIQPPPDSDIWQGNNPSDGRIFACDRPGMGSPFYVFIPGTGTPDPARLAQEALDSLTLTVPTIKSAPSTSSMTYVGLRTWLWFPESNWNKLTKTVSAGATSVTVTAIPKKATWDMGPKTITCNGPGREWISGRMSDSDTTTCGYAYTKVSDFEPGKKFTISARITFRVDWRCSGECLQDEGTLGNVDGRAQQSAIRVGERQSVNVTPEGR